MLKLKLVFTALLLSGLVMAQEGDDKKMDSLSYSLGMMQANDLLKKGFEKVDIESYGRGLNAVLTEETPEVDLETARSLIRSYLENKKLEAQKMNLEKGQNFLAENAKREEVEVTESGLQYEILVEGEGEIPDATSKVVTHYTGTLIDGSVFDSSVERGEPISFPVGGVIKGWQEALQLMPEGSKWKLYIPYDLAYGATGAGGGVIPPYATLIFEIELIEVK